MYFRILNQSLTNPTGLHISTGDCLNLFLNFTKLGIWRCNRLLFCNNGCSQLCVSIVRLYCIFVFYLFFLIHFFTVSFCSFTYSFISCVHVYVYGQRQLIVVVLRITFELNCYYRFQALFKYILFNAR